MLNNYNVLNKNKNIRNFYKIQFFYGFIIVYLHLLFYGFFVCANNSFLKNINM